MKERIVRSMVAVVPLMVACLAGCTSECPNLANDLSKTPEYAFFPGEWLGNFGQEDSFLRIHYGTDNQCIIEQRGYVTPQGTALCHLAMHGPCAIVESPPNEGFFVDLCLTEDSFELLSDASASQECKQHVALLQAERRGVSYGFVKRSDTEVFHPWAPAVFVMYKQ